ncbi:MAG: IPT/TIG domain-containing protein [Chloroflexi bacterium]|nr:IPT/TIG domain-containing protein [Chloroflexota bacterium]
MDVAYDPAVLGVAACTSSVGSLCNTSFAPNTIRIVGSSLAGLTGTQTLASLTFQAVGARDSSSALTVALSDFADTLAYTIAASTSNGSVTVAVQPTVTALSQPPVGPTSGGTRVTITGYGFAGATAVHFGSLAAQSFQVVSDTQVIATSPAQGAGTVDMAVATPYGTSAASAADQFTYQASGPFVGASIEPSSTTVVPGATATVALQATLPGGLNLGVWTVDVSYDPAILAVADCTSSTGSLCNTAFGASTVRVTGASATGLAGTQPLADLTFRGIGAPGTSGALSVAIQDFADASASPLSATPFGGQIRVGPPPTVTAISPATGPGRGGTLATISGSDFLSGATVALGGRAATEVTFISASSLSARTPAHSRAVGDVNGNGSVTSVDALCILRLVAALPEVANCPAAAAQTAVDVAVITRMASMAPWPGPSRTGTRT